MRRLARMEELIEKMNEDEDDANGTKDAKHGALGGVQTSEETSGEAKSPDTDVNRFIGSSYWRSLTNEVGLHS